MADIAGKKIAILATNGFEQSELEVPLKKLREAGATVDVVSPESGEIKGWDMKDWGRFVKVDKSPRITTPSFCQAASSTPIICVSTRTPFRSSGTSTQRGKRSRPFAMPRGF